MFDDELVLITNEIIPDEIGNQKTKKIKKTILCNITSASRNEFYNYGDAELRPEYIARINSCEYDNEHEAIYQDESYTITRTYKVNRDQLELTLSRMIQR